MAVALIALLAEAPAHADARISMLADVNFGTLSAAADQTVRQNVCAYARQGFTALSYGVRATGSGAGSAFTIANGARTLAYEVQWADAANQTAGTQLTANVLSTGYDNSALFNGCTFQTNGTATLIVIIRGTQAAAATAGNYSGTLHITIVPQ
ncbi:hypothetical protein KK137_01620 [Croceibacterium sp. LX-88]|uniref:Spore coat protein U domain-containing protein n=1 Tax=Croceibacterium selenioxidans TaxID=2838833 RepID=A0ABS5W187_9SPHN|nr:hypothetical protein [Croceibacterium selenioxidans]MBT2133018.1 hypothetical protein [Croceibacterium selenioxidans]